MREYLLGAISGVFILTIFLILANWSEGTDGKAVEIPPTLCDFQGRLMTRNFESGGVYWQEFWCEQTPGIRWGVRL